MAEGEDRVNQLRDMGLRPQGPAPREDLNCLSYWFPKIERAGLPVPQTYIVETDAPLENWLDGMEAPGSEEFLDELRTAVEDIGLPCFLRTGHGSAKHDWLATCYLTNPWTLGNHVAGLVEWSHTVDLMGLPHDVWAVRELIPTEPLFTAFNGMPITREFRFFVRDGVVEHRQPYWEPQSIERPSTGFWQNALAQAALLDNDEAARLERLAVRAGKAVGGGYWSVDLLQDVNGEWWITDMAEGERSYRWEPTQAKSEGTKPISGRSVSGG